MLSRPAFRPPLGQLLASRCGPALLALCGLLLLLAYGGAAAALTLDQSSPGPLGRAAQLFVEDGSPLPVEAALALQRQGRFRPGEAAVPKFGIGARPVWLHLQVDNRDASPQPRTLVVGVPWIDRLDVHVLRDGQPVASWRAGDAEVDRLHPVAGIGFVFEHDFAPGVTELLLRAETDDPLVLPVELLAPAESVAALRGSDHRYGLLYGYFLALIAYNAMLYVGLRERSHLDYAIYLGAFVLTNLAYSGHGYAWLWPDFPGLQRYVILVLMVLFCCAGLRFASRFLELKRRAPGLHRMARWMVRCGLGLIALAVLAGSQAAAALVAFGGVLVVSVTMVGLGVWSVARGQVAARYFLAAALAAMAGAMITAMAVWRGLPFSSVAFHVAELGVALEGTLLALALAYRMRQLRLARAQAEALARIDPLTGLLNRRAFMEQAAPTWSTAVRSARPLAVMLVDLDHFKRINDSHGHAVGDRVLVEVGATLAGVCRGGDLCARWGGEEFIILLPETGVEQAMHLAERLRRRIESLVVHEAGQRVPLSASMGIAGRDHQADLEALIREADGWLYRAKETGRGRVCAPLALGFEIGT
ncbi:hypothetical protein CJ010_21955 [Azoarcus sp. DD4]|uniref:sensor domain-containing diguanylate cyclase n=1 Tax=Azoarcus sp. DD4 TaxID=2027405 RepID=UPI001129A85E|nr:diguanylate cyclase [Azoarcus sp. DD4]QDF99010.1 hypothetical protein CJ010_21955 [Azoarcus sp. DD4]